MCGLAGFWQLDGRSADTETVTGMLNRQQARGPDDRGVWTEGPRGLGLDRLSIMDLSDNGHQPFLTADGSSVIAYNGEVYNWRSLRRELEAEGIAFRSDCDTEVVLYALSQWGPETAVARFNGMFAFAWFDLRSDSLWLARDRTGIKPLYFAASQQVIAFASEAKALFAHPAVSPRADTHALVTHIYLKRLAGDWTAFEGVKSLVPGTLLHVTPDNSRATTWFDVERDVDVDRILQSTRRTFPDQVGQFRERLEQSVEAHLQSDAPLAVMCSGGLDSSLTTALAKRHKPDLLAYVAEVEDAPVKEAEKAQQVADHLGISLRRIRISDDDYPGLWCRAAYHNDDPIFFHQNPLTLRISEAVSNDGFKVLVTGEGADELFGGYPWQREVGEMWKQRELLSRLIPNIAPLRYLFRRMQSLAPVDMDFLAGEPFERRGSWLAMPPGAELVIDAGIRRAKARALFRKLEPIGNSGKRAFLAKGFDDIYHHLRVLLSSNDKMTMACSVEMRVPFLENELIDFGLHLDPDAKLRRQNRKRIVKAAAYDLLPAGIVDAEKVGFAVPDRFWLGYESILNGGLVAELFKWPASSMDRVLEVLAGQPGLTHKIVSLEIWAQIHLNGVPPEQMEQLLRAARTGTGQPGSDSRQV